MLVISLKLIEINGKGGVKMPQITLKAGGLHGGQGGAEDGAVQVSFHDQGGGHRMGEIGSHIKQCADAEEYQ